MPSFRAGSTRCRAFSINRAWTLASGRKSKRQLQTAQAAQDANLKVPFEALRQMKTLQGAETFGDGTPTLNGYMGGKVYRAYGGALQGFANHLDPALGAQYSKATGDYNDAMDASAEFQERHSGGQREQLTSTMMSGLKGPENIKVARRNAGLEPGRRQHHRHAGAHAVGSVRRQPVREAMESATDAAKTFYTRGSPGMRSALDAAANLGSGFRSTGKAEAPADGQRPYPYRARRKERSASVSGEGLGGSGYRRAAAAPLAASAGIESRRSGMRWPANARPGRFGRTCRRSSPSRRPRDAIKDTDGAPARLQR